MGNTESSIHRCKRDLPPAHYMMEIKSYSTLLAVSEVKYDSCLFETGGHKWKLSLYPKGKENNNYISLDLVIEETDSYADGWEVFANVKFFVYDQIHDNYLTIQDANATVKRFHRLQKKWGLSELISLESFNNSSNGYLVDDCCVFGVEVCVIKHTHKWESLSMVKRSRTFTWKLQNFSTLDKSFYDSTRFSTGETKWFLRVYPKGYGSENGKSLSIYLHIVDCKDNPKINADFKLRVLDQSGGIKKENLAERWYSASSNNWGFASFIQLVELKDPSKGFIVRDIVTFQVQINVVSVIQSLPSGN